MKQFISYGNSDQASFRDSDVRDAFDYLTVPGTIAAYYPDATAAFVLSSDKDYLIDLRTPLFQGHISAPRASHFALAEWFGPAVQAQLGDPNDPRPVTFDASWYSGSALDEMLERSIEAQRNYGGRAEDVQTKLARYGALLAEALGVDSTPEVDASSAKAPSFILAPYFAASSLSDAWWHINAHVWARCAANAASDVSPVVAVGSAFLLAEALSSVPSGLSTTQFWWVTGLDERRATESELHAVAEAVRVAAAKGVQTVNLYGSFFSIALDYAGLWGFGNGLGYSESRNWPELPQTGAAPARYYVRDFHSFMSPTAAQRLIDADPSFACDCSVCASGVVATLTYGALKRHFANARVWEMNLVRSQPPGDLAASLSETAAHVETETALYLPSRLVPDVRHLRSWSGVLRTF